MIVYIIAPNAVGYLDEIDDEVSIFQEIVGGNISIVRLPNRPDIAVIIDDEGKLKGYDANFMYGDTDYICGTAIFAGVSGEDLVSLSPSQYNYILNYIAENEPYGIFAEN